MSMMSVAYNTIRLLLIDKIRYIKAQCEITAPCSYSEDSLNICNFLKITLIPKNLPNGEYAFYSRDKKLIAIDTQKGTPERVNFSFFHEISHHIIENDDEIFFQMTELVGDKKALDDIEEELANVGAAEFLMPSYEIKALIDQKGFSIRLFPEIYEKYPASRPAVLIQMAQYASHKCILCMCDPTLDESLHNRLKVEFSTRSPSTKYFMGKSYLIPLGHYLNDLSEYTPYLYDRNAQIPYKKSRSVHKVFSEGIFYDRKVYALFNLNEPPLSKSEAPTLF